MSDKTTTLELTPKELQLLARFTLACVKGSRRASHVNASEDEAADALCKRIIDEITVEEVNTEDRP